MAGKNFIAIIYALIVTFAASVTHAQEEYDYKMFMDVPVRKLIHCWDYNHVWDHSVYTTKDTDNSDILIVVCHGVDTNNGEYMINIYAQQRTDYAEAVESVLNLWESEGNFNGIRPSRIILHTCFSGRAPYPRYNLTNFHGLNMEFATLYTGVNAHSETYDEYGNVSRLQLYNAFPIKPGTIRILSGNSNKAKIIID